MVLICSELYQSDSMRYCGTTVCNVWNSISALIQLCFVLLSLTQFLPCQLLVHRHLWFLFSNVTFENFCRLFLKVKCAFWVQNNKLWCCVPVDILLAQETDRTDYWQNGSRLCRVHSLHTHRLSLHRLWTVSVSVARCIPCLADSVLHCLPQHQSVCFHLIRNFIILCTYLCLHFY